MTIARHRDNGSMIELTFTHSRKRVLYFQTPDGVEWSFCKLTSKGGPGNSWVLDPVRVSLAPDSGASE